MKIYFKIIIFTVIILVFAGISQSCKKKIEYKTAQPKITVKLTPVEYNDSIIGFQERVIRKVLEFSQTFQNLSPSQKESKVNDILNEINNSIENLRNLGGFFGNVKLNDACLNWLNFYKSAFNNEYKEIIQIATKPPNEITEKDIIRMDDLQKKVAKRELEIHKEFSDVQKEFYQQFDIKGKENKLDKQVEDIGKKK